MRSFLGQRAFEEITFFGGIVFYIFLIMVFLIFGKFNYALQMGIALAFIYLFTLGVRLAYFKNRPKKQGYGNMLEKMDASSFPSVHAARTTFIFLFLMYNLIIFQSYFLFLFYLCSAMFLWLLVLYSRIYLLKHDVTDIIGGVMLGIISLWVMFIRIL
jgi:membrane-associated phospholipid phosphatase